MTLTGSAHPAPEGRTPVAELLHRMLEGVFDEPDERRRTAVIAEVCADDVVFTDEERTVIGRHDLAVVVTGLLAQGPGLVFTPHGPFRGVGDLGAWAWRLGPPGGAPVLAGTDVVQVADGRIGRLWTLLDAPG